MSLYHSHVHYMLSTVVNITVTTNYSLMYSMFWVIARRLNFLYRRFGTPCSTFTGRLKRPAKMEQSVTNRRHRKLRRRGITQKKEYIIHNTAKVSNQEKILLVSISIW